MPLLLNIGYRHIERETSSTINIIVNNFVDNSMYGLLRYVSSTTSSHQCGYLRECLPRSSGGS